MAKKPDLFDSVKGILGQKTHKNRFLGSEITKNGHFELSEMTQLSILPKQLPKSWFMFDKFWRLEGGTVPSTA